MLRTPIEDADFANMACTKLSFLARIATPSPETFFTIVQGHILEVRLTSIRGQLHAATLLKGKLVVGYVSSELASRLEQCLGKGICFEALVLSLVGGYVTVNVRPVLQRPS